MSDDLTTAVSVNNPAFGTGSVLLADPIDWLLGADGDIVVTTDVQWSRGLTAKTQQARIAMRSVKGEWFVNPDEGIPLWERDNVTADEALMGQAFSRLKCLAAYREALNTVPDITIKSLTADFDGKTRTVNIVWAITCVFGDTDPDTIIVPTGAI